MLDGGWRQVMRGRWRPTMHGGCRPAMRGGCRPTMHGGCRPTMRGGLVSGSCVRWKKEMSADEEREERGEMSGYFWISDNFFTPFSKPQILLPSLFINIH